MSQPLIKLPEEVAHLQVIASCSGGKDSTALILALREAEISAIHVFADTRWEARETYAYLDYLRDKLKIEIEAVVGRDPDGMTGAARRHGCYPSRMARYCTRELKIGPLIKHRDALGLESVSAVGLRGQESARRAALGELEDAPPGDRSWGGWIWRPLLKWTIQDVLKIHNRHGLSVNPLYHRGHDRVGCYPCIFATKAEIALVAENAPERIDEIRAMEQELSGRRVRLNLETPGRYKHEDAPYFSTRHGIGTMFIDRVVEWSQTSRGGRQLPLFQPRPRGGCMRWGLCEVSPEDAEDAAE